MKDETIEKIESTICSICSKIDSNFNRGKDIEETEPLIKQLSKLIIACSYIEKEKEEEKEMGFKSE